MGASAYTKERLEKADNGGQRATLLKWIAEQGLSTAHFLGQAHRRGKPSTTSKSLMRYWSKETANGGPRPHNCAARSERPVCARSVQGAGQGPSGSGSR